MAAATTAAREFPARALRSSFLWASHRRSLQRVATATPLTRGMVWRFVAGETQALALDALARLCDAGFRTTADVLGESVTDAHMAAAAAERYVELLDALAARGLDVNVSLKLTQMGLDVDADLCRRNVARIVGHAAELDGFVRVDMEDHPKTDATLGLVRELHGGLPNVGTVIQAYLRRSEADISALDAEGIRVRLCKGAYNEPASVAFAHKVEVDASFARLMERLLVEGAYPALATHDERLIARARRIVEAKAIGPERFEFQMLYGIRRDLQERLRREGFTVRVYVPFGREWYPYFMRRLAERPANVLFLTRSVLREGRGKG
ncbi:MAG: proline dehydrogenase family protein [Candidatus Limnocylindrales bacterium]